MRLSNVLAEEDGEVFNVENRVANGPAVVFVRGSCERETLGQLRRFECCVRSDVGIAIIDLAGMICFVAITVREDEQRSIPDFRHTYPVRRAVDLT